jgi:hypothetical protein
VHIFKVVDNVGYRGVLDPIYHKNKHLSSGVAIEHNSTMGKSVNDIHLCKNLSLGLLISLNLSLVNFPEIASLNSTLLKFLIAPDCDESLTCRGLNLISGHFSCFTFIFVSCAESCLLVSWCAGGRCGMGVVTRIMVGVVDLEQRTRHGRTGRILGGRMIRRSADAMCGLYCARGDEEREFLG